MLGWNYHCAHSLFLALCWTLCAEPCWRGPVSPQCVTHPPVSAARPASPSCQRAAAWPVQVWGPHCPWRLAGWVPPSRILAPPRPCFAVCPVGAWGRVFCCKINPRTYRLRMRTMASRGRIGASVPHAASLRGLPPVPSRVASLSTSEPRYLLKTTWFVWVVTTGIYHFRNGKNALIHVKRTIKPAYVDIVF